MIVNTQRDFVASVFGGGGKSKADKGRYNVLLMGGDSGADRIGTRPDSMTVASIDADTGRTVLIGLPRNLAKVPFPAGTAMAKQFPEGFLGTAPPKCLLNAVYTYAADHKNLFPGDPNPGETATKQAIEAVTGLKINYFVLIDLAGFRDLLNAVGGITLDIGKRVPIGGGSSPIKGYIEAGKNQHLDGYHALWFARSRAESSDYERMARQKCVMSAMLNQLSPQTVLTKFQGIASASKQVVKTDIPASRDFHQPRAGAKKAGVKPSPTSASCRRLIHPGDPNFDGDPNQGRRRRSRSRKRTTARRPAKTQRARRVLGESTATEIKPSRSSSPRRPRDEPSTVQRRGRRPVCRRTDRRWLPRPPRHPPPALMTALRL